MKRVLAVVVCAGCASGNVALFGDGGNGQPDSKVFADGQIEGQPDARPDAHVYNDAHVYDDAHIYDDAHVYNDAHIYDDAHIYNDAHVFDDACVPLTSELLANPVFDLTPAGLDWQQTPIDPAYPPITSDGFAAQSAPYKAWMGGFTGDQEGVETVTDVVYQDIVVPANTTHLAITGYYVVGTTETDPSTVYDTGSLALIQTNGTPIENVLVLSNLTNTGATWLAFSHTFTTNVSGQTVRLRMTSTNDVSNVTNFFFDTLSVKATHCP